MIATDFHNNGAPDRWLALLFAFYTEQGRHTLPWRHNRTPYRVWVSEVMLQQTGVLTVIPYYQRFMEHFPTIQALAQASLEEVLLYWQGLGYYQRARHLHKTAGIVVKHYAGHLPEQYDQLLNLPGIGVNTAAAILAIAFNQPHTIIDGNVQRVMARLTAGEKPIQQKIARWLTAPDQPGKYAQAIMDLGATVCLPRQPRCLNCPWLSGCQAYAQGEPERYPVKKNHLEKPRWQQASILLFGKENQLLLVKRKERGLLAGLWEPIATPMATQLPVEIKTEINAFFHLQIDQLQNLPAPIHHTFTHFHLTVWPYTARWIAGEPQLKTHVAYRWVNSAEIEALPISTLHRKIIRCIAPSILSPNERR